MLDSTPPYPAASQVERCLDLLFPPICVQCRRVGRWVCARCWTQISWAIDSACGQCGTPSVHDPCSGCARRQSSVRTVVAVAQFERIAREAVHALKYEGRHAIAPMMGRMMARAAQPLTADVVIPTPLHSARKRERGYDQATMLARTIGRELRIELRAGALRRVRRTAQQVSLGPDERRRNVAGAFACTQEMHGEIVLLVDDVYTTGATMEAAASALLDGGARSVIGLVFGYAQHGRDVPDLRSSARSIMASLPGRSTR